MFLWILITAGLLTGSVTTEGETRFKFASVFLAWGLLTFGLCALGGPTNIFD